MLIPRTWKKYEPIALMQYENFMFNRRTPVKVLPCEFVVSKVSPIIGATSDTEELWILAALTTKCP